VTVFRRDSATAAAVMADHPLRASQRRGRPLVTSNLALRQSVIWAGANLHAAITSMMPVDAFRYVDGIKINIPTPAVLVSPSDFGTDHPETFAEWNYARTFTKKTWGNYFAEITSFDSLGKPAKFMPIPVDDVSMKIRNYQIVEWKFGKTVMDVKKVWHERGPLMAGNPVGMSPIGYAMTDIEVRAIAAQYLADWFGNSATPGGILKNTAQPLTPKQRRNIKASYETSTSNGEVFVTGSDWDWVATQAKAAESGFLEAMNYSDIQLCRFTDTPANMIDVPVAGGATINYANITQKNLDFMVGRMGPDLKRSDDAFTSLLPAPRFARLVREAFLAMDPVTRADLMKTQIESRQRTVTEVRGIDDKAPYTEADYAEFDRLFGTKNQNPTPKGLPA
jgi:hypothetical protein